MKNEGGALEERRARTQLTGAVNHKLISAIRARKTNGLELLFGLCPAGGRVLVRVPFQGKLSVRLLHGLGVRVPRDAEVPVKVGHVRYVRPPQTRTRRRGGASAGGGCYDFIFAA